MKKEDIISTIVYIVMLIIVAIVGYYIISENASAIISSLNNNSGAIYGFVIISLLLGVILNVFLVEIGHLIGAKIGGYNILSFNFLGLCIYKKVKEDGKIGYSFGVKNFDGLAGETKIVPNKKRKKSSPMAYIIFPFIIILIEFLGLYLCFLLISDKSSFAYIKYGYVLIATVGGIFFLYDYMPFKLDTLNDGYRYTLLIKKINVEAFNENCLLEESIMLNKEIDNFTFFNEITDYTAEYNLKGLYFLFDKKDYTNIHEVLDSIINTDVKISREILVLAKSWNIYTLLEENKLDEAKEAFDKFDEIELKTFKKDKSLPILRSYIYYLGIVEKAYNIVDEESIKYLKNYKNELSFLKDKDKELFEEVVKKIEVSK